jgi:3',5'-cyclic-AMP phosphodiesterase
MSTRDKHPTDPETLSAGEIPSAAETAPAPAHDGIDRRNFLSCMAWAGAGMLWTVAGGVPTSRLFAATPAGTPGQTTGAVKTAKAGSFSFVQISDSHIGFHKQANMDVTGTLKIAIDKINASQANHPADFMLHTGDITQMSKPAEFDTAEQVIKGSHVGQVHYVPGEHDTATDDGVQYRERFGKGTMGSGWYSFDHQGVHFVGLNNCVKIDAMGALGHEQLDWMKKDLSGHSASTPIVVFAHIPLWMVYSDWGWGTDDGAQALSLLRRFGSVTVLNGHIHQTVQKVEGNVSFHTAASTAFPQPAPGKAPHPGPMTVPAGQLESVLGVTTVNVVKHRSHLAIVDSSLDSKA